MSLPNFDSYQPNARPRWWWFMNDLSHLNGKSIAITLIFHNRMQLLRGVGIYERDTELGKILRIHLAEKDDMPGDPHFVIREDKWDGTISEGSSHDCEYSLVMDLRQMPP